MSSFLLCARPDTIVIGGEVDAHTCRALVDRIDELAAQSSDTVGLRLDGITFVDIAGLRAITDLWRALEAAGVEATVASPNGRLEWLADLARLPLPWAGRPTAER